MPRLNRAKPEPPREVGAAKSLYPAFTKRGIAFSFEKAEKAISLKCLIRFYGAEIAPARKNFTALLR